MKPQTRQCESPSVAYSYTDANLLTSNKNEVLRQVLDYLDVVQYYQYKRAFLSSGLGGASILWGEVLGIKYIGGRHKRFKIVVVQNK